MSDWQSTMKIEELFYYDSETGDLYWKVDRKKTKAGSLAGSKHGCGYISVETGGKGYLVHRIAWKLFYGVWPVGIDHINGNPADNRIVNLREADQSINNKNSSKPCNNTSGVVGVYWFKPTKNWMAAIGVDGKQIHLGYFNDKHEAAKVRKLAEKKYGFHPNHGRQA